jgi:hypothetical protein
MTKNLVAAIEGLTAAVRDLAGISRGDTPDRPEEDNSASGEASGVWISADAPQWEPWAAHWRATKGMSPPRDAKNGWRFPSFTPPNDPAPAATRDFRL